MQRVEKQVRDARNGTGLAPDLDRTAREIQMPVQLDKVTKNRRGSDQCVQAISSLLQFQIANRLGCATGPDKGLRDIMAHPFFASISWADMLEKTVRTPYKPMIKANPKHTSTVEDVIKLQLEADVKEGECCLFLVAESFWYFVFVPFLLPPSPSSLFLS